MMGPVGVLLMLPSRSCVQAQVPVKATSWGPSQKAKEINFQNRCNDSRHPAHGPTKTLSTEVMGQSAAGAGVAVGVTIGESVVTASMGAQEQRADHQSNSGPTCRLTSSPEEGPGATVGTLD
jgi:hypothetical protein